MKRKISLTILFCFLFAGNVFAAGIDAHEVGLKGVSMASAFTGLADDASAVFYNPAGLTQLEQGKTDFEIGVMFAPSTMNYTAGGKTYKSNHLAIVPDVFVGRPMGNWAFGLGIYAPYGLGGNKFENMDSRYGQLTMEGSGGLVALGLSLAAKILPNLSVGLTGELLYGFDNKKVQSSTFGTMLDDECSDFAGARVNLGLLYSLTPDVKIGLTIKSPSTYHMNGTEKANITGINPNYSETHQVPWYFDLGASYKVTQNLTLSAEFDYNLWGTIDKKGDGTDTNWQNSIVASIGVEYKFNPAVILRGGLGYMQPALKQDKLGSSTATTGIPAAYDVTEIPFYGAALGIGYKITPYLELTATLALDYNPEVEHNGQKWSGIIPIIMPGLKTKF